MNFLFDGHKCIWHMDRIYDHFRDGKRIYPVHIDKMSGDIIPWEVLVNLFESAPKIGIRSLTVTGDGEPTLNPAIWEALPDHINFL